MLVRGRAAGLLLAVLLGSLSRGAAAVPPCLPERFLFLHRDGRDAALLVTAAADTVAAGWGDVPRPGYLAPERQRPIHGQVVEVSAIGGPAAGAAPTGRAVLVGWDLGYDCKPVPLAQSAVWMPEGAREATVARLRRPHDWVNGVATYDVLRADWVRTSHVKTRWAVHSPEPPEVLFEYFAKVPTVQAIRHDPWGAVAPLREWLQQNPDAAARTPIRSATRRIYEAASDRAVTTAPAALAGTYRLEVSRTGGPVQVVYLRTSLKPRRALRAADTTMVGIPGVATGYHLPGAIRRQPRQLPSPRPGLLGRLARRIGFGDRIDNAYLDVRFPGVEAPDGSVHFRGFLLTLDASWLLREDPQFYRLDSEWYRLRQRDAGEKEPAEIVLWPDGRVEITQVARLDAERAITVRGERISTASWTP